MTTTTTTFSLGQDFLSVPIALEIAAGRRPLTLTEETRRRVADCRRVVEKIAGGDAAVYGINTGFGPLCTTQVSAAQTEILQLNLLRSHAVGLGSPVERQIAKLMLVLKAHALAQGFSGIRTETLERIIHLIEADVVPVVPTQGSVGASGDLAPLSHLFLPLIGEGEVEWRGETLAAADYLREVDLPPLRLGAKEGLALINGTQFIAAHAVMVCATLQRVLLHADLAAAMMVDGLLGSLSPFEQRLHELRPYNGAIDAAANVRTLLTGSEISVSHADCGRVQDPYSLRCVPQVHGASREAYAHLRTATETELNSVTDNPIVFPDGTTISGGNFHGQLPALPLDYACLAAAEIGNISDRRTYLSLLGQTPGVPKLLVDGTGLNSGLMIPQYTGAALVSENKTLCFPASADSIPTSLGQEDHVSMGAFGGRKALRVVRNVEQVLAIELFCAVQALDFHAPLRSGPLVEAVRRRIREDIPRVTEDRLFQPDLNAAVRLVREGMLLKTVREADTDENLPAEWRNVPLP